MFSSNGMYLIIFTLCVIAGYNLNKAKKKKKKADKENEIMQLVQEQLKEIAEGKKEETNNEES